MLDTIPERLNIRVDHHARQDVATMLQAINAPHRKPATVTDAVRAALEIAAGVVRSREGGSAPV